MEVTNRLYRIIDVWDPGNIADKTAALDFMHRFRFYCFEVFSWYLKYILKQTYFHVRVEKK